MKSKKTGGYREQRQAKLSVRISVLVVILALSLTVASFFVGSISFGNALTRQYNETAYQVAATTADYFTEEELVSYAEKVEKLQKEELTEQEKNDLISSVEEDESYKKARELTAKLRKNSGANDIYLFLLDLDELAQYTAEADEKGEWTPLTYIADCYSDEEESFSFGAEGSVVVEYMDDLKKAQETGERPETYFVSNTQFGYNTTAILPIVYQGKTVMNVGVEIPMKTLISDINKFRVRLTVISFVILVVALLISVALIIRLIVRPIHLVAAEANNFVSNNTEVSEKLSTVKTRDEIQLLAESILAMEQGINLYIDNLQKVTAEKERIGAELNVATQIQADMLPSIFPAFPGRKEFDIYASMTPAKEVGGDFYDFFLIDEDHLAMVMADVSGKGVPAALFMVIAKTLIKNHAQLGELSPAKVLMSANEQLCEGNEAELFVTVWLGILEISTGKGMAANAGHEHPALRRKGGKYELIEYRHSPAVATMEGIRFREHEFELHPGDSLFVYTDGVAEATNANNELFGNERLVEALNKDPELPPKDILINMKKAVDDFVGTAPQFDDITMLGLSYFGPDGHA